MTPRVSEWVVGLAGLCSQQMDWRGCVLLWARSACHPAFLFAAVRPRRTGHCHGDLPT